MKSRSTVTQRIEFFGLCGAGKSTFYEHLKSALLDDSELIEEARPNRVPPLQAILAGVRFAFGLISRGQYRFLATRQNWWLPMKLGYRLAQLKNRAHQRKAIIAADTGLLQPLVSFAAEHNHRLTPIPVREIVSMLSAPHVAIFLQAPVDIALQRYRSRERHRLTAEEDRRLPAQFAKADEVCQVLLELCRVRGLEVFTINSSETRSETVASEVSRKIREILKADK